MNKQSLTFLTLTSLILVLSVYYITMPNELLLAVNNTITEPTKNEVTQVLEETSKVSVMKSLLESERLKQVDELNNKLLNTELSNEEKNDIYEEIKYINKIESMEANISSQIQKELNVNSYVEIKDEEVNVTVEGNKDLSLVIKIMNLVDKELDASIYTTVTFK